MCETTVEESLILNFELFTILYFFSVSVKKPKTVNLGSHSSAIAEFMVFFFTDVKDIIFYHSS